MYQLNVDFSDADLQTILAAGEQVVITKHAPGDTHNIAWLAFDPMGADSVQWSDSYTVYASRTMLQGGATITMMSQDPAVDTAFLPFNGGFLGPDPAQTLPEGQYGVENLYNPPHQPAPMMVFGLAQEANVTGTAFPASPINASIVPANQNAVFTPLDVIQVFVAAQTDNGMVLTDVSSSALPLTFGAGVIELTVKYNATIGGFQAVASEKKPLYQVAA